MQIFYYPYEPFPASQMSERVWVASCVRNSNGGYGNRSDDVHEDAGLASVDVLTGELHVETVKGMENIFGSLLHNVLLAARKENLFRVHLSDDGSNILVLQSYGFTQVDEDLWTMNPQDFRP